MRRTESTQAGFTLIEVMIAMGLLAVAVLGIVGAQLSAIKFTRDSHFRAQAMFLAEQLRATVEVEVTGGTRVIVHIPPEGTASPA